MPGAGGTQRLTRTVGKSRAMELVLTGRQIGAQEATAFGIANRVVPTEATVREAMAVARAIADGPPLAVRAAKRAVQASAELPLAAGLAREREAFFDLFATEDQAEGMSAFTEKRAPRWAGR
jgi:enoyl-CoA hydratase